LYDTLHPETIPYPSRYLVLTRGVKGSKRVLFPLTFCKWAFYGEKLLIFLQ